MSAARDYSDTTWPWDGDPNWDQPREGATYDPGEEENWRLGCSECGLHFPTDIVMATVADHWRRHFEDPDNAPKIQLNLIWVGLGVPPKPQPPQGPRD